MLARFGSLIYATINLVALQPSWAEGPPLPQWVDKAITELRTSHSPDVYEESTYNGKRAFLLIVAEHTDMGDEHILFSEDGQEICKFGGLVGKVTSGACDIEKIKYVRTIYPN